MRFRPLSNHHVLIPFITIGNTCSCFLSCILFIIVLIINYRRDLTQLFPQSSYSRFTGHLLPSRNIVRCAHKTFFFFFLIITHFYIIRVWSRANRIHRARLESPAHASNNRKWRLWQAMGRRGRCRNMRYRAAAASL